MKKIIVLLFVISSLAFGQQATKGSLTKPSTMKERAPDLFKAKFDTSAGVFIIEVHADWAPNGADRFYNLVKNGYYDGCRFFRVVPNFMVQFGINGDPAVQRYWINANIPDDKVKQGNERGFISYGKTGAPNSRSTQVFINYKNNASLNSSGFAAFGKVISGMDMVDKIYKLYGEKPDQQRIQTEGNAYLTKTFPKLDYIKKATIEK